MEDIFLCQGAMGTRPMVQSGTGGHLKQEYKTKTTMNALRKMGKPSFTRF